MARPVTPILSRDRIRDAALALIDAEGLGALTMRRLASDLGVQAASIYGHFTTKDAVLDAIANLLTARVDTSGFAEGWLSGVRRWGTSYHAALTAHPNAVPIVAAGARQRQDFLAMADAVHGGLVADGWPPRYATMVAASVKYLVIGAATTPFATGFADDVGVYAEKYPNLAQAHLLPRNASRIDAESFALGLDSLITGLRSLHDTLRGTPRILGDDHR